MLIGWCGCIMPWKTAAIFAHVLCTPYNPAPVYSIVWSHISLPGLSVHAGLFFHCCQNSPSSDVDYMIFVMCTWSFCVHIDTGEPQSIVLIMSTWFICMHVHTGEPRCIVFIMCTWSFCIHIRTGEPQFIVSPAGAGASFAVTCWW